MVAIAFQILVLQVKFFLYFLSSCCRKKKELNPRTVLVGHRSTTVRYPANKICNQKYNVVTFLPGVSLEWVEFSHDL